MSENISKGLKTMKYIDIFLASSITDLRAERMELGNYIRTLNDLFMERGLYFRLHLCEDISDEIALTRKQDEYNDVIRECEYFFVLFKNKAGAYTVEEFDVALEQFRGTGAPKIRTYFIKTDGETSADVAAFMHRLETELQHYYNVIESIDTIKLKLLLEFAAKPELKAKVEFRDSEVLLDGESVKSIDLEKLPIYANHESISKMKEERLRLEQDFVQARLNLAENPADDNALHALLKVNENKNKVIEKLHELETELMDATTRIVAISTSGEYLTARAKKAIELFEEGKLDDAMAILDDEERKRETEAALKKLEEDKNELRALVKEITLKIDTIKAKGVTEKSANEVIALYEEAWDVITKGGLEFAPMKEYVLFLNMQKRYGKAVEKGEKLYHILKSGDDTALDCIFMCEYIAGAYGESRNFEKAEALYKEALDEIVKLNPAVRKENEDLEAMICNDLAKLYMESGRFGPAESLFSKAFKVYHSLAENNPAYDERVALVCNNFGELYRQKRDFKMAEKFMVLAYNKCVRLYKKQPGVYAQWLSLMADNLGVIMMEQGKLDKAEKHISVAIDLARSIVKSNPFVYELELMRACNNMAVVLMRRGQHDEALKYYKEALDTSIRLAAIDPDVYDQYVAAGYNNLAVIYMQTLGEKKAIPLQEKALDIYRKLAKKNPNVYEQHVAMACGNLARAYGSENEKCMELYFESLEIYRRMEKKNPGTQLHNVCMLCNNIGSEYNTMERYYEAETYFNEILSYRETLIKRGNALETLALAHSNLGDTLFYTDRDDEAEKMYRESLRIYSIIAETNPREYIVQMMSAYTSLASLYEYNDDTDSAEKAYLDAISLYDESEEVPLLQLMMVGDSMDQLAELYTNSERLTEAVELLDRAVALFNGVDKESLPVYGEQYMGICFKAAEANYETEDYNKAEKLYAKAGIVCTKMTKDGIGDFEPFLCRVNFGLYFVYGKQGRTEEMDRAYSSALRLAEKYKDTDDYCEEIYEILTEE